MCKGVVNILADAVTNAEGQKTGNGIQCRDIERFSFAFTQRTLYDVRGNCNSCLNSLTTRKTDLDLVRKTKCIPVGHF
ncbi:Hypothetical predicted protein [Octopus vulgaris]|uniref:Uncharacterized protein n=1 Tax=Octopus vulgaris TaxID=6645 RepID=A0AA36AGI7_OCTVU|nr:Hypothetical predicted protein [Octopus vulgaris]